MTDRMTDRARRGLVLIRGWSRVLVLSLPLLAGCAAPALGTGDGGERATRAAQPEEEGAVDPRWQTIDRLVSEQKMQAAAELAAELAAEARAAGDEERATRALIKQVQLRTALSGYATAVELLRAAPRPESPRLAAALELFTAHGLVAYRQAYGWEIEQRERVAGDPETLELERWTGGQIFAAAQRAYAGVWRQRQAWGSEPVGALGEFVEQNDYPPRIRGTLRDTVTYLWVELLADRSLWSPEHANGVYRLELERLLAERPLGEGADELATLEDESAHPLLKIAVLLADLEAWHRAGDRPEAALEARLERVRRLAAAFDEERHRELLVADLESALERLGRAYPWWSAGRVQQAELVRAGDGPEALVAARALAAEALEAHPESFGGERARYLVAVLEAPSYQLTTMALDGAGERSLEVRYKNVEELHLRAYRLDLERAVATARDYNLLPGRREVEAMLAGDEPAESWRVELPPTPDLREHRHFVTPPLERPGLYVIVASTRRDFRPDGNRRAAVAMTISDLVPVVRDLAGEREVIVRSGASGEALAGCELLLYRLDWRRGHERVARAVTGADGRALFGAEALRGNAYFLLARRGDDQTLLQQSLYFGAERESRRETRALVYTDRSAYRPGQEVLWKVVAYAGDHAEGRFETLPLRELTVELVDANGEVVASEETKTGEFGSAAGRFTVPPGRLLGGWQVRASLGGAARVLVEEYRRPTFEVEIEPADEALRLNRPATFRGSARYYFGLPVVAGEVVWRVEREPVYPPFWWWWGGPRQPSETLAAGRTEIGSDGVFAFTFTPEADESQAGSGVSYRFRVHAELTDEGGETRSASRSFRLGFVAVEAAIERGSEVHPAGEPLVVVALRRDLDGEPRPGTGSWRLTRLEQPSETPLPAELPPLDLPGPPPPFAGDARPAQGARYLTAGDLLRPRWETAIDLERILGRWPDGEEIAAGTVEHRAGGAPEKAEDETEVGDPGSERAPRIRPAPATGGAAARIELGRLPPGAYRLHYRTEDAFGAIFETRSELVVAGEDETPLAVPLALLAEEPEVPVGGVARVWAHSGLAAQPMVLEVFRGDERVSRRELRSGAAGWIEIPVGDELRGGFGVVLSALRDHQLMTLGRSFVVPWDDRRLEVSFETFRDRLRPGSRERWSVRVAGADDEAVAAGAAEVLAVMTDRSLEIFAPFDPPDPLALYPTFGLASEPMSALGASGEVWNAAGDWARLPRYRTLRGDRLRFFDGYGIGGPGGGRGRGGPMVAELSMAAESAMVANDAMQAKAAPAAPPPPSPPAPPGDGDDEAGAAPDGEAEVRSDFAETAFWEPQLITGADGSVSFEFEVPDALTDWLVWAQAITRDLASGQTRESARTVKELLVRPYPPRFLREGDRAELRVVVQNAGDEPLAGSLDLTIEDAEDGSDLGAAFDLDPATSRGVPFRVEPGGSETLTFALAAPRRVGVVALRAVGRAGAFSDGELRPLPVLPGRLHLSQSRFAALSGSDRRTLELAELMADDDPTRIDEALVVTLDAQLFYSVLEALPYLVEYPHECTEQTLNRFLSTGILASLYDDYPAVARMAKSFAARETPLESWDEPDPNRRMLLVETPWLVESRGGVTEGGVPEGLVKVLDPQVARAQRVVSLAKLEQAQTSLGAFPWWPGGPPSPYMTLYILYGFSKALEFGIEVPQPMVERAWAYMHRHYADEIARRMVKEDCCWETTTFLAYVLSAYDEATGGAEAWTGGVFSADDRTRLLEHSFGHWRRHSPLLKGYLALALARAGRGEDARLVFDSVMDSATSDRDLGTYWQPEPRAWLWTHDTVEGHAMALRTLTELDPDDPRRDGLVHWLMLNKKLNHWKSTRTTAEVLYALVHYLEREGRLGAAEAATVRLGERVERFDFDPGAYTGKKTQLVVDGADVEPAMGEITVEKETPGLLFASATWHYSTERLPAEAEGDFFAVGRRFFRRHDPGDGWVLEPLADGAKIEVGDQLEIELTISSKHAAEYVHVEDPRGAGFEPETTTSGYEWNLGLAWYREVRDSGVHFFVEQLPAGEFVLRHRVRATQAGVFRVGPASVQSMYAPEFNAHSSGAELTVGGGA